MQSNYTEWNQFTIDECYDWQVPTRYTDLISLAQGAFGLVCSAFDNWTSKKVAIKKLSRPFETRVHAKRAFREIKLLKHVNHDNIISLMDIFYKGTNPSDLSDIYLVTNLMSSNLKTVIRERILNQDQIMFFTYQILRGIKYLHSANIIHRDLKPENITVNENLELRIIDFGLARSENERMTGYVASKFYRAPEIMLKWMNYSKAVDIWSIGCILAEMHTHQVLFEGETHISYLNLIINVTGFPSNSLLEQINVDARDYLQTFEVKPQRVNFYEYFSGIQSSEAINLIDKMLELDPDLRISCDDAIRHSYVVAFHDEEDEPVANSFDDLFESEDICLDDWKSRVFAEINAFRPNQIED